MTGRGRRPAAPLFPKSIHLRLVLEFLERSHYLYITRDFIAYYETRTERKTHVVHWRERDKNTSAVSSVLVRDVTVRRRSGAQTPGAPDRYSTPPQPPNTLRTEAQPASRTYAAPLIFLLNLAAICPSFFFTGLLTFRATTY